MTTVKAAHDSSDPSPGRYALIAAIGVRVRSAAIRSLRILCRSTGLGSTQYAASTSPRVTPVAPPAHISTRLVLTAVHSSQNNTTPTMHATALRVDTARNMEKL